MPGTSGGGPGVAQGGVQVSQGSPRVSKSPYNPYGNCGVGVIQPKVAILSHIGLLGALGATRDPGGSPPVGGPPVRTRRHAAPTSVTGSTGTGC